MLMRRALSYALVSSVLVLLGFAWSGCQPQEQPAEEPPSQTTTEALSENNASKKTPSPKSGAELVEGWDCEAAEECFGWRMGLSRSFRRSVGARVSEEKWRIIKRQVLSTGAIRFEQEGGSITRYEMTPGSLKMTLRGELLEVLRFPLKKGQRFTLQRESGSVEMSTRDLNSTWNGPAGSLSPCLLHVAQFQNPERSQEPGLRVETTLCKGVGETLHRVHLDMMPHPIEWTLLSKPK